MALAIEHANIGTNQIPSITQAAISFTTTQTVAAGGFIVAAIGWYGTANLVASVSGGGLSWAVDFEGQLSGLRGVAIASAQAPAGLASGATITFNSDATWDYPSCGGMSFTGVATSSPVDGTPLGPVGAATAAWSSGSYAIAAGSVIVAGNWNEGIIASNTETSPSIEAFESIEAANTDSGLVVEYRIESSAGSYAVAGTWDAAHNHITAAVAYLAAAEDGSVPQLTAYHGTGMGRW